MLLAWRPQWLNRKASPRRHRSPRPIRAKSSRLQVETLEDRCVPSVDVILEWNAVALQAVAVDHTGPDIPADQLSVTQGPTGTARALGIVHAAMFDAFNSIDRRFTPYLTLIPVFGAASTDAAVAQAGRDTLVALYPQQRDTFNAALDRTLDRVPDGPAEIRGRVVGRLVALSILVARANDGSNAPMPYDPISAPGFHNVDPLHPGQSFLTPRWGDVEPFVLTSSTQFPVRALDNGTPAGRARFLRSAEYTAAYNEVKSLGGNGDPTPPVGSPTPTNRTAEQTEIGIYWSYDGSPGLGTPPRLYNQIARTVAIQEDNTVRENARLFALVNLAMADAGIASWEAKYDFEFWRPILGIRGGANDGNPQTQGDPNWSPLGAQRSNPFPGETNFTPPFPAYTSGHATFGAAMFQTLTRFYGRDNISFTFVSDELNGVTRDQNNTIRPLRPRTFSSFSQAKEENGQSRIYLGIHWAFDKTEGIRQGNRIANFVFNNELRPLGGSSATADGTSPDAVMVASLSESGGSTTTSPPTGTTGGTTTTTTSGSGTSTGTTTVSSGTDTVSSPASPEEAATDLLFSFPELFAEELA